MKQLITAFILLTLSLVACRKDEDIETNNPNTTISIPPLPASQTEGVYRMRVIKIDVVNGYSYYSYPQDTNVVVTALSDRNLQFTVFGQHHFLNFDTLEDNKFKYIIDNYSPNYSSFANFIENDLDSMYFYTSVMTGGTRVDGVKYIFSGRKTPW